MAEKDNTVLAKEYKVHSDHPEVSGDVDGSMTDHKNLLENDQNCVEKITKTDNLDSSNTGDCCCDLCDGKCGPTHHLLANNRIARQLMKLAQE